MTTPAPSGFSAQSTAEDVTAGVDLTGRTFVVTGCNSGLGYETARVLGLRGARVIGLARSEAKANAALHTLGLEGRAVACDLADLKSVQAAVAQLRSEPVIHGIIANAGVMALPELEQVAGYERQFFTNHIGHFLLVTGLLGQLSDDGRVVMLSSGAHRMAPPAGVELDNLSGERDYDPWKTYGQSKLANLLFARSLARKFKGSGRTANAVHPGVIDTNLGRHVVNKEAMYERYKNILKTTPQGAATQVYVATHPTLADVSGQYFSDCDVAKIGHAHALDNGLADRLWKRSEAIVAEVLGT